MNSLKHQNRVICARYDHQGPCRTTANIRPSLDRCHAGSRSVVDAGRCLTIRIRLRSGFGRQGAKECGCPDWEVQSDLDRPARPVERSPGSCGQHRGSVRAAASTSRAAARPIPEGLAAGADPGRELACDWRSHNGSAPWVLCPAGRDRLAIRRLLSSQEVGVRPSRMDQANGQQLQGHGAAEE